MGFGSGGGGTSSSYEPQWLWSGRVTGPGVFSRWVEGAIGVEWDEDTVYYSPRYGLSFSRQPLFTLEKSMREAIESRNPYEDRNDRLIVNTGNRAQFACSRLSSPIDTYMTNWLTGAVSTRTHYGETDWIHVTDASKTYIEEKLGADTGTLLSERTGTNASEDDFKGAISELMLKAAYDTVTNSGGPIERGLNVLDNATDKMSDALLDQTARYGDVAGALVDGAGSGTVNDMMPSSGDDASFAAGSMNTLEGNMLTNVEYAIEQLETIATPNIEAFLGAVIDDLTGLVDTAIDNAVNKAQEAINTSAIDDAVDAFEASALPEYMRSINRFNGGLVDINAVHGSAFILGNASLENQYKEKIEAFRAQLTLDVYTRVLSIYMETFQRTFASIVASYTQQVSDILTTYRSTHAEYVRSFLTLFSESMKKYLAFLSEYSTTFRQSADVTGRASLTAFSESITAFRESMRAQVNSFVNEALNRRGIITSMLHDSASQMLTQTSVLASFRKSLVDTISTTELNTYNLFRAEAMDDIGIKKQRLMWDIDIYSRGANILSAAGGAVTTTTEGPSPLQQTLSFLAVGAKVAGVLFPPAAPVAAAVAGAATTAASYSHDSEV